jgi:hypothetical protein
VKRLALLWLLCAAIGFVVAAGVAMTLALTLDRSSGSTPPARTAQSPPARLEGAQLDQGRRLLGD